MADSNRILNLNDPEIMLAYEAEIKGEYPKALEHYKIALEKYPEAGIVYKHAGNVYYREGYLKEAIEYLEKAVDLLPGYPTAIYDLGLAYYRQVRIDKGIKCMKKVLGIDQIGRAHV